MVGEAHKINNISALRDFSMSGHRDRPPRELFDCEQTTEDDEHKERRERRRWGRVWSDCDPRRLQLRPRNRGPPQIRPFMLESVGPDFTIGFFGKRRGQWVCFEGIECPVVLHTVHHRSFLDVSAGTGIHVMNVLSTVAPQRSHLGIVATGRGQVVCHALGSRVSERPISEGLCVHQHEGQPLLAAGALGGRA